MAPNNVPKQWLYIWWSLKSPYVGSGSRRKGIRKSHCVIQPLNLLSLSFWELNPFLVLRITPVDFMLFRTTWPETSQSHVRCEGGLIALVFPRKTSGPLGRPIAIHEHNPKSTKVSEMCRVTISTQRSWIVFQRSPFAIGYSVKWNDFSISRRK